MEGAVLILLATLEIFSSKITRMHHRQEVEVFSVNFLEQRLIVALLTILKI